MWNSTGEISFEWAYHRVLFCGTTNKTNYQTHEISTKEVTIKWLYHKQWRIQTFIQTLRWGGGGGDGVKKKIIIPRASVWSKNKGGRVPPLDPPLIKILHPVSRASFCLLLIASSLWSRRNPNFWTSQSCFFSSNWFFQGEHPFIDNQRS